MIALILVALVGALAWKLLNASTDEKVKEQQDSLPGRLLEYEQRTGRNPIAEARRKLGDHPLLKRNHD